jgi:hypothetical protein
MWWKNNLHSVTAFMVGIIAALAIFGVLQHDPALAEAYVCERNQDNQSEKINCWQEIIRGEFENKGTSSAFDVFETIYANFRDFSDTGCHRHAHRVGDMAYYFDYLTHKNLEEVDFPQKANLCGYGFYHGFFEHLVQNNPDPEYVTATCTQMKNLLPAEIAPAIQQTCYHGSGHGFLLAQADLLTDSSNWDTRAFLEEPLKKCEALNKASQYDREECRQGVYNVFTDWMFDGEYNLSFNFDEPFKFCNSERKERRADCYYEIAQKFDSISGKSPIKIARLSEGIEQGSVKNTVMSTAVAGIVQSDPSGSQKELLKECRAVTEGLVGPCIAGIVGGLVEHDISDSDYVRGVSFCTNSDMTESQRSDCFEVGVTQILRFRTIGQMQDLCTNGTYPEGFCSTVTERAENLKVLY